MKSRFLSVILFLLFLVEARPAFAAAPVESSPVQETTPVVDPAQVAEHYRQVLHRPEYQEAREPDADTRMRDWLSQWFARLGAGFNQLESEQEMPRFASLLMTLFVILSLVGLIYILVRLTRRRGGWNRSHTTESPGKKTFRPAEFYDGELAAAVSAGDWHGAWLASWRQFLSRLEDGRLVEADRSRTNREYLGQLRDQALPAAAKPLLSHLVDAYDQFIYGRKTIAEPDWNSFREQVDEATLLLELKDRSTSLNAKAAAS